MRQLAERFPTCMLRFFILFLFAGCVSEANRIEFVIPDQFNGRFVIIEVDSGTDVDEVDGTFVVTIPESGVAEVSSVQFLRRYTERHGRCRSGGAVTIHSIGEVSGSGHPVRHEFFVGSAADASRSPIYDWPVKQ